MRDERLAGGLFARHGGVERHCLSGDPAEAPGLGGMLSQRLRAMPEPEAQHVHKFLQGSTARAQVCVNSWFGSACMRSRYILYSKSSLAAVPEHDRLRLRIRVMASASGEMRAFVAAAMPLSQ
jgi:hypothetical protein